MMRYAFWRHAPTTAKIDCSQIAPLLSPTLCFVSIVTRANDFFIRHIKAESISLYVILLPHASKFAPRCCHLAHFRAQSISRASLMPSFVSEDLNFPRGRVKLLFLFVSIPISSTKRTIWGLKCLNIIVLITSVVVSRWKMQRVTYLEQKMWKLIPLTASSSPLYKMCLLIEFQCFVEITKSIIQACTAF
jgi:hypothetical protein